MHSKLKWIIIGVIVLVLLVVVLLPLFFNAERFRPEIESRLTQSLGRQVKIGQLKLALFSGGVTADDLSIADDPAFSSEPFIKARSLAVGVEMKPLIFDRQVKITSLVLNEPVVRLLQSAQGKWNFSTLGSSQKSSSSSGSATPIEVKKLDISNGRIEAGLANGKTQAYTDVQLGVKDFSTTKSFPFDFSASAPAGGKISAKGTAGPINNVDASKTPFTADIKVSNFDLTATGFMPSDSALAGIVDYEGKVTSDGKTLSSDGKAKANKLRLVKGGSPANQPVEIDYHSQYDLAREQGTIDHTVVRVGKSVANVAGTSASRGATTVLNLKLNADKMAVSDIQALLPALGITLPPGAALQGGTLSADLDIQGPTTALVTAGTANLANSKIAGFSMGKGLSSVATLAGLPASSDTTIQTLASNLRVSPDGTRLDGLRLLVTEIGEVTGAGNIAANGALDFHLVAKLANGGGMVGALTQLAGMKGLKTIPFAIKGTTAKPVFIPDVGAALAANAGSATPDQQQLQKQLKENPVGSIISIFGKKKNK